MGIDRVGSDMAERAALIGAHVMHKPNMPEGSLHEIYELLEEPSAISIESAP